jgi:DNA segregation ATPase FtsK/SpoIIIE, S-DNA-T family
MRLAVTVVSPATRRSTDIVLDADPATPMTAVAAELDRFARGVVGDVGDVFAGGDVVPRQRARPPSAVALYVDGQRIWQRLTLAEAPIRDGCVISLGSPDGCVLPEPVGLVDVLVAGGPDAGAIHRIGPGRADVGSGAGVAVRIGDPAVPSRALLVRVDDLGGCQVAAYPGAAATVDRLPLGAPAPWRPGQRIAVGGTLLGLAPYAPPDAALRPSPDGAGLDFSRPPRTPGPPRPSGAELDSSRPSAAAAAADRRLRPILMAGLPLVVGLAMAFLLDHAYLLAMAAVTPVLLAGGALGERTGGRRRAWRSAPSAGDDDSYDAGDAGHSGPAARIDREARAAAEAEQAARREQCPDPATALGIASGPRRRLWERRRTDPDYLLLRVGTADLPVTVELAAQELGGREPGGQESGGRRRTVVRSVPDALVTVPLAECGVLGVAGPGDCARAVGRWLVASAAILHSPNDLRIYLLTDDSGRAGWEWVRWLPHCRPGSGGSCVAQLGNDAESVAARIAELLAIVAARRQVIRDGHRGVGSGPGIVVVLDGSRRLRSLPGVGQLLAEGPPVGVYAICLDDSERLLPRECQTVAVLGRGGLLRLQQTMADTIGDVRADHADPGWCARVARSLAPIRDVSGDGVRRPVFAAGAHPPTLPTPAASASATATATATAAAAAAAAATAAAAAATAAAATTAREVWLASVDWAALGRPEPAAPAARLRGRDSAAACSLTPG